MVDENKTAIISYIDNYYIENLEYDFLRSLYEKAHYKGKIIILNYGIALKEKEELMAKYNIEIIDCKKIMPVFSNRYQDLPRVIDNLDESISHILLVDCGDVWFQDRITTLFCECEERIGSVEERRSIGGDEFTQYCLDHLDEHERNRVGASIEGRNIINSGLICGPRELVRDIIIRVGDGMKRNKTCFFGVDQVYYDYEWYMLENQKKTYLEEKYNYVLISNIGNFTVENDVVCDKMGKGVTVVHNAGANWRVLKRPFENKNVNEQQYFDVQEN